MAEFLFLLFVFPFTLQLDNQTVDYLEKWPLFKSSNISNYSRDDEELICYTNLDQTDCTRCSPGVCVLKFFKFWDGREIFKAGCQKKWTLMKGNTKNKCQLNKGKTPQFMKYKVTPKKPLQIEGITVVDEFTVYKKCCFESRCNDGNKFMDLVFSLNRYSHDLNEGIRRDTRVICIIFLVLMPILIVYSVYVTWRMMTKKLILDYRQSLDPKLLDLAITSTESDDETLYVTGGLSINETAEILANMIFPPKIETEGTMSSDSRVTILPLQMMKAKGVGHTLVAANRERPFYMQSILFRMIEHGPYFYPFKPMELLELFDEASNVYQSEKTLVHIGSCAIIGDIRGGYADLHRWLQAVGWPPKTRLLFLGNVLDNDVTGSLEVIALISALKIAFPSEVFLLRGQTETFPFTPIGRFPHKTGHAIGRCIMRMCSFLPMAAIVKDRILAVPSGITPLVEVQKDLADLPRPATMENLSDKQRHLIFNQPSMSVRMYRRNKNSHGDFFGSKAVERICSDLQVNMIVRGGAPIPEGYCSCWDNTLISLWSAPGKDSEIGAILLVSIGLEMTPVKMIKQTDPIPFVKVSNTTETTIIM